MGGGLWGGSWSAGRGRCLLGTCLCFPVGDASCRLAVQDGRRAGMEIWVLGLRGRGGGERHLVLAQHPPVISGKVIVGLGKRGAWFPCGPRAVPVFGSPCCGCGVLVCGGAPVRGAPQGRSASTHHRWSCRNPGGVLCLFLRVWTHCDEGWVLPALKIPLLQRQWGVLLPAGTLWGGGRCGAGVYALRRGPACGHSLRGFGG